MSEIEKKDNNIWEDFPEIWHYTTEAGLVGILDSKSVWSTAINQTNDVLEGQHGKEFLTKALQPTFEDLLKTYRRKDKGVELEILKAGGLIKAAAKEAEKAFDIRFQSFSNLNDIYITSFCSTEKEDDEDGLLSQWRAYGQGGGYAIVFDTKKLWDSVVKQIKKIPEYALQAVDVAYGEDASERFKEDISRLADNYRKFFKTGKNTFDGKDYSSTLNLIAGIKHRGFREEREVRLCSFVFSSEYADLIDDEERRKEVRNRPNKVEGQIGKIFLGGNAEFIDSIKRIVIGPNHNKEERAEVVRNMLVEKQIDIPVECSTIPFLGMHYPTPLTSDASTREAT